MNRQGAFEGERGFTLIEVLITIILMGLLLGIASPVLFGIADGRRVDSATNQLAADLRQAHTTATNRLVPQVVNLSAGNSEYSMTGFPSRDLDDDALDDVASDKVTVDTTVSIAFCPDGSAVLPGDAPLIVSSADDGALNHEIEINAATSRIQIDP